MSDSLAPRDIEPEARLCRTRMSVRKESRKWIAWIGDERVPLSANTDGVKCHWEPLRRP